MPTRPDPFSGHGIYAGYRLKLGEGDWRAWHGLG